MKVMEGSLQDIKVPINNINSVVMSICNGVKALHSIGVMHRDIKPGNVLINLNEDNSYEVRLTDFGMSRDITRPRTEMTPVVFTMIYRPLEILLEYQDYDFSSDIWALGCTIYELYSGDELFKGETQFEVIRDIIAKLGTPEVMWPRVVDLPEYRLIKSLNVTQVRFPSTINTNNIDILLFDMLDYNPDTRPDIYEVIDYLTQI